MRPDDFFEIPELKKISIHAPTWGATLSVLVLDSYTVFQSTHPRGVRPNVDLQKLGVSVDISIHAPTWGATAEIDNLNARTAFQSTHPRGVRLLSHQMVGF